ncbi:MAG: DUF1587 domain-containing protein, partial [Verrucomicrobiota bacterium]
MSSTGVIGRVPHVSLIVFAVIGANALWAAPKVSSPSDHPGQKSQTVLHSVDAKADSKWCGHHQGKPVQWQVKLPEPQAISGYSLTSAGDVPSRDPDHWVLEGSLNGKSWQPLDRQNDQPEWEERRMTKQFGIENQEAWRFYRFTFRFDDPSHYQLSEIALEGVSMEGVKLDTPLTIEELRAEGKLLSKYLDPDALAVPDGVPTADLAAFHSEIKPLLEASCVKCHGPDKQKGDFRVDTLDPDMVNGDDGAWWVEVTDTISQGEMPPPDEEDVELVDADRAKVVDWISQELLVSSQSRRSEEGHTSFRRLTRYETSYALQDLLGLPYEFAKDLPPETESEDGFQNSSDMLQMTAAQFETYREIAHTALTKATVRGDRPEPVRYAITGKAAETNYQTGRISSIERLRKSRDADTAKVKAKIKEQEEQLWRFKPDSAHFVNLATGRGFVARSGYGHNSFLPLEDRSSAPGVSDYVLALPRNSNQLIDLGDRLPSSGTLRLRIRAWRSAPDSPTVPDLRINFGYQPSNNSKTSFRVAQVPISSKKP